MMRIQINRDLSWGKTCKLPNCGPSLQLKSISQDRVNYNYTPWNSLVNVPPSFHSCPYILSKVDMLKIVNLRSKRTKDDIFNLEFIGYFSTLKVF